MIEIVAMAEAGHQVQADDLVGRWEGALRIGEASLPLVVRSGDVVAIFARLQRQHGIAAIHAHQETGNDWTFRRDRRVLGWARDQGIALTEHPAFGVVRRLRSRNRWTAQWEQVMGAPIVPLRVAPQPPLPFDAGVISGGRFVINHSAASVATTIKPPINHDLRINCRPSLVSP